MKAGTLVRLIDVSGWPWAPDGSSGPLPVNGMVGRVVRVSGHMGSLVDVHFIGETRASLGMGTSRFEVLGPLSALAHLAAQTGITTVVERNDP